MLNGSLLSDDSWLDDDTAANKNKQDNTSDYHTGNNSRFNSGYGDRVYSGRESPAKTIRAQSDKPQRVFSSSTTDSFDYAYQRSNGQSKAPAYDQTVEEDADFFDT